MESIKLSLRTEATALLLRIFLGAILLTVSVVSIIHLGRMLGNITESLIGVGPATQLWMGIGLIALVTGSAIGIVLLFREPKNQKQIVDLPLERGLLDPDQVGRIVAKFVEGLINGQQVARKKGPTVVSDQSPNVGAVESLILH